MKVTVKSYDAHNFVEVRVVTKWKDGAIYKTKHKGFARIDRPMQKDEVYSSLSTTLLRQREFELVLLP